MSARALLNRVETFKLDGLDEDGRDVMRWLLRDPEGFAEAQAQEKTEQMRQVILEAGGEIG